MDALLTADWHLRFDTPKCRTDDYLLAQEIAVLTIDTLSNHGDVLTLVAGDIFDYWKTSPELLSWAFQHLPKFTAIPGQHDLPGNSLSGLSRSGLAVLKATKGPYTILDGTKLIEGNGFCLKAFPFGVEPINTRRRRADRMIAMCHTLVWHDDAPLGFDKGSALRLLRKLEGYDLVVVGDNHTPFVVEDKGRLLVSPGSLMRMKADQLDYTPRVYAWNAKDNTVEPHYLPIEQGVVTTDHLHKIEERDNRIDSFVARLKDNWEVGLSFEKNLTAFFSKNRVRKAVKEKIWKAMDNEQSHCKTIVSVERTA